MRMGFLISHKNKEERRAVLPEDIAQIKNKDRLFFEKGYGLSLGYDDECYAQAGANITGRNEVLKSDILVDVKLGDAGYLDKIKAGKILTGWAHAVLQIDFAGAAMNGNHTVIAWEEMYQNNRCVFYRNNEIAGEAAILHGFRYSKKMPYDSQVCIIGNGQTAKGCLRVLHGLGAKVDVYPRKLESLFKEKMFDYDVIINCVMWDTNRPDRLIYKSDLRKFKKGTLIIDVSCNSGLEIETAHATTIDEPIYEIEGIIHYAVDHTPTMYAKTATKIISDVFKNYVDEIIDNQYSKTIKDAIIIHKGCVKAEGIRLFREKRGYFVK